MLTDWILSYFSLSSIHLEYSEWKIAKTPQLVSGEQIHYVFSNAKRKCLFNVWIGTIVGQYGEYLKNLSPHWEQILHSSSKILRHQHDKQCQIKILNSIENYHLHIYSVNTLQHQSWSIWNIQKRENLPMNNNFQYKVLRYNAYYTISSNHLSTVNTWYKRRN